MKQSPQLWQIQQNMQPGAISAHGFLGDDTRKLVDILHQDDQTVRALGLTHELLADRLAALTTLGEIGLGDDVRTDDNKLVRVDEHRGRVRCPFQDGVSLAKKNTTLTDLKTKETLTWSDLNVHMIREHGFYEGIGAYFRIEPRFAAKMLGLLSK